MADQVANETIEQPEPAAGSTDTGVTSRQQEIIRGFYTTFEAMAALLLILLAIALLAVVFAQVTKTNTLLQRTIAQPPASTTPADVMQELERLKGEVSSAFDTLNSIMTLLEVVGLLIAVFAGVGTLAGLRTQSEYRAEFEKARVLLKDVQIEQLRTLKDDVDKRLDAFEKKYSALEQQLHLEVQDRADRVSATLQETIEVRARALQLVQLGQQQISLGNRDAASDTFREAQKLDPNNRVILYFLADTLVRRRAPGDVESAQEMLRFAAEGEPEIPAAKALLAYALRLRGDSYPDGSSEQKLCYGEAEAKFAAIFDRYPDLLDTSGESVYGAFGGLYRRRGMVEEAIKVYKHALSVTPESSYPLNALALVCFEHNDEPRFAALARESFERSLEKARAKIDRNNADYWAWADYTTALIALDRPQAEIDSALERTLNLVWRKADPLGKFISGLKDLARAPAPPKYVKEPIEQAEKVWVTLDAELKSRSQGVS